MRLKYKISLPSIVQAIIMICLVSYIAIQGSRELTNLERNTETMNTIIEELNAITNNTDRFFLSELSQSEFEASITEAINSIKNQDIFDGAELITHLEDINGIIRKAQSINGENTEVITSIIELTEVAISQSMQFIVTTATNLADEEKRNEVSTLERLVIIGATNNNMNNSRIQTMIYKMLREFEAKDELLEFVDKAIENTTADIEKLRDTPFVGLAVASLNANNQIKDLTLTYVKNTEQTDGFRDEIKQITSDMLDDLSSASISNMEKTFGAIFGLGILLIVVLIIITVIVVTLGLVSTAMVTRPLLNLKNQVTTVVENGDFSVQVKNAKKDEIGETVNAFNQLMRSLQAAISEINTVMSAVSTGDFSRALESEQKGDLYVLKESVNNTINLLGATIQQVISTSDDVNSGAQELSQSAQALASGTTEQAASLEEVSSTSNVIDSKTRENAEKANQAKQLTDQALNTVRVGNEKMNAMVDSINTIEKTSADVTKVIKVIDEIAFQTNLLALNAAVEAARAGQAGKGFAVVAEEVRSLASRSAEAVKDTTELVETSVREVEAGVANSNQTAEALAAIDEVMTKIATLAEEIAEASREQTIGIDEVNKGLSQINSVVQQNSSISEETSSSSDELASQARNLRAMISRFKLGNEAVEIESIEHHP